MTAKLSLPRRVLVATLGHPLQTAALVYLAWRHRPDWWPLQIAFWLGLVAVLVASDALGHYWLHNPYAERLKARTAGEQPVSGARLAYLLGSLLAMFTLYALVVGAAYMLRPHFPSFVSHP